MCPSIAWTRLLLTLALVFMGVQIVGKDANDAAAADVSEKKQLYVDQGWTANERQRFNYTTQGSQLIPYHWFLALETVSGEPRAGVRVIHCVAARAQLRVPRIRR